jgi:hypothetical protein
LKDPRDKVDAAAEQAGKVSFTKIRQSVQTWNQDYLQSTMTIKNTLFITNPTIVEIINLFDRYKNFKVFDVESFACKEGPFEIRSFRSLFLTRLERGQERLMTT